MTKEIKRVTQNCTECGSTDVRIDAWASWDEEIQEWVLAETYENPFCMDCEGGCRIEEEEVVVPPCPDNCEVTANGKSYDCPVCPRIWHPKFEGEES